MKVRLLLLASACFVLTGMAAANTMTFEGLATNQYYTAFPYVENGISLYANTFWIAGPGGSTCGLGGCVDDGTNVAVLLPIPSILAGPVFTLNSLDYAETFVDCCYGTTLTLKGNLVGGGSQLTITVPLVVGAGFTHLDLNWANLTSVDFYGDGWFSLDNISVTNAPEPGTLALLGTGVFGIAGLIRRKRS
jgi:hypothetical protein